jgi:Protein of unknown function (DUF3433)
MPESKVVNHGSESVEPFDNQQPTIFSGTGLVDGAARMTDLTGMADPSSKNVLAPGGSTRPDEVGRRQDSPTQPSPADPTNTASQTHDPSNQSEQGPLDAGVIQVALPSPIGVPLAGHMAMALPGTFTAEQPMIDASTIASPAILPSGVMTSRPTTPHPTTKAPTLQVPPIGVVRTLTANLVNVQPGGVPEGGSSSSENASSTGSANTSASPSSGSATNHATSSSTPASTTGSAAPLVSGASAGRPGDAISLHSVGNPSPEAQVGIVPNGQSNNHAGNPMPTPNNNHARIPIPPPPYIQAGNPIPPPGNAPMPHSQTPNLPVPGITPPLRRALKRSLLQTGRALNKSLRQTGSVIRSCLRSIGQVTVQVWQRVLSLIRRPHSSRPGPPKEWRSWKVEWPWLSLLLFIEVSLILVVATLHTVSQKSSGFVRLQSPPSFLAKNPALAKAIWQQGILYTTFPTLLMTVYRMMWESSVTAFADRQPYVDLKKRDGGSAEATVMLDYRAVPTLWAWSKALRNGHLLLSACLLLSLILSLGVVPLTAFLFTDASFNLNNTFPLSFTTSFNDNTFPSLPDLRQTLDFAASMRLYDGGGPAWIHEEYAFPKFQPLSEVGPANISVETTGYSAYLDCRTVPSSEYELTRVEPIDTPMPATNFIISANDRGCAITNHFRLQTLPMVLNLEVSLTCSLVAHYSRLIIVSAVNQGSPQSRFPANLSLISCIPSYWQTPGTLTVRSGLTPVPFIKVFSPSATKATEFRPEILWRTFEPGLQNLRTYDPSGDVDSSDFGRYAYSLAKRNNPSSPIDPGTITDAVSVLFAVCFAVLSSTQLFKPATRPKESSGISSTSVSRIIVVTPVAFTIIAMLSLIALMNIGLFFYSRRQSILLEEPAGLLSYAGILHESHDISDIIEEVQMDPDYNGQTVKAVNRLWNVKRMSAVAVSQASPLRMRIRVRGLYRRQPIVP